MLFGKTILNLSTKKVEETAEYIIEDYLPKVAKQYKADHAPKVIDDEGNVVDVEDDISNGIDIEEISDELDAMKRYVHKSLGRTQDDIDENIDALTFYVFALGILVASIMFFLCCCTFPYICYLRKREHNLKMYIKR